MATDEKKIQNLETELIEAQFNKSDPVYEIALFILTREADLRKEFAKTIESWKAEEIIWIKIHANLKSKARETLDKYGTHISQCRYDKSNCRCGFAEALKNFE